MRVGDVEGDDGEVALEAGVVDGVDAAGVADGDGNIALDRDVEEIDGAGDVNFLGEGDSGGVGDVDGLEAARAVVPVVEALDGGAAGGEDGLGVGELGVKDVTLIGSGAVGGVGGRAEEGAEGLWRREVGGVDGEELAEGVGDGAEAAEGGEGAGEVGGVAGEDDAAGIAAGDRDAGVELGLLGVGEAEVEQTGGAAADVGAAAAIGEDGEGSALDGAVLGGGIGDGAGKDAVEVAGAGGVGDVEDGALARDRGVRDDPGVGGFTEAFASQSRRLCWSDTLRQNLRPPIS